jgi:transcriptional regulator with XRE-family HTH domain
MGVRLNPIRLHREMALRGLHSVDLARLAGLSAATVSSAMQGRPVSPRTLRKIVAALARVSVLPGTEELLDVAA